MTEEEATLLEKPEPFPPGTPIHPPIGFVCTGIENRLDKGESKHDCKENVVVTTDVSGTRRHVQCRLAGVLDGKIVCGRVDFKPVTAECIHGQAPVKLQ